ncbi:MAG TPA: hypothetical protein PKE04_07295, partial [Clostridia bacterium]|nr:hypothetical protein [Clostridia bacterium]
AQPPISLVAPARWQPEEKRLVLQIDSILKDIYRRWGRLGLSDFSLALRRSFDRTVTVDDFESVFRQTAESLSVQFGTPDEVRGPSLEVSKDRLFARVPEIDFIVTDAHGQGQAARFRSVGGRFVLERLTVHDVECPVLLRWDREYGALPTTDKTVFGAFLEMKNKIDDLERRVYALENPPEEEP